MSTGAEVVVGLVILVGVVGIIVPVLPGTLLVLAAIGVWAFQVGTTAGWAVFGGATLAVTAAFVAKYAWPGRRLKAAGVPNAALMVGGLCALVGFFVIPFVGLFVGFPLGVYLYELQRQQNAGGRVGVHQACDEGGRRVDTHRVGRSALRRRVVAVRRRRADLERSRSVWGEVGLALRLRVRERLRFGAGYDVRLHLVGVCGGLGHGSGHLPIKHPRREFRLLTPCPPSQA
ncbi:MAG: DUF456 domain-containing protein [Nocardioidaceae bacterium]